MTLHRHKRQASPQYSTSQILRCNCASRAQTAQLQVQRHRLRRTALCKQQDSTQGGRGSMSTKGRLHTLGCCKARLALDPPACHCHIDRHQALQRLVSHPPPPPPPPPPDPLAYICHLACHQALQAPAGTCCYSTPPPPAHPTPPDPPAYLCHLERHKALQAPADTCCCNRVTGAPWRLTLPML
jgi:hypothetical protein